MTASPRLGGEVADAEGSAPSKTSGARPFLKWAGGKARLLPELLARLPEDWDPARDEYYELLLGGGALFWALQPWRARLNDACGELVRAYDGIRKFWPGMVLGCLRGLEEDYRLDPEGTYYRVRDQDACPSPGWGAARTIFLNKVGFNGLYRVNKAGRFNVPWGKNPGVDFVDEANLSACAEILRRPGVVLSGADYEVAARDAPEGSLVYFDPPYVPSSRTRSFTAYTAAGFGYQDHLRLVLLASSLRDRGVHVVVSESADESLVEQYRRCGFRCDLVRARRSVSSRGGGRGAVGEYIIY